MKKQNDDDDDNGNDDYSINMEHDKTTLNAKRNQNTHRQNTDAPTDR